MKKPLTVEQMCRDLLTVAMQSGVVGISDQFSDPNPQVRTSGELIEMANALTQIIADLKDSGEA
jgi:hypothetical protein